MLIGILADIHEAVSPLRNALSCFDRAGVEQVVTLGDAFETYRPGGRSGEVASLLTQVGAVGVWGNHDVGLSQRLADKIRQDADPALLNFTTKLQPHVVIENCRFSHVEPWLDPCKIEDLWYFDVPDTREKASRSFEAVADRYLFIGHHHRWIVMSSSGRVAWDGETELALTSAERYLVVAAAVVDGWCSTFDTVTGELTPIQCAA